MKNLALSILTMCFICFSTIAHAAEEFTLWADGTVVAAPYPVGGVILQSAEFNNNNNLENLEVVITFEDATPDQCDSVPADYKLFIQVEGAINGIWYPVATSHSRYNNCDDAPKRIIKLGPNTDAELTGYDIVLAEGYKSVAKVSHNVGVLTDKFRVKIILQDGVNAPLTNLVLSGFGRKF